MTLHQAGWILFITPIACLIIGVWIATLMTLWEGEHRSYAALFVFATMMIAGVIMILV